MKSNKLQTKRDTGQKSGFRMLHAKTKARRKQRAVAAVSPADLGADVPNVGIGRALIVILVLHVVAIGAVIMHTSWTDGQGESYTSKTSTLIDDEEGGKEANVQEDPRNKEVVVTEADRRSVTPPEREQPTAVVVQEQPKQAGVRPSFVDTGEGFDIPKAQPVLGDDGEIVRAEVVQTVQPAHKVLEYTVQKGDSIWRICRRYEMSVVEFKKLNQLKSDTIRIGQKLLVTK